MTVNIQELEPQWRMREAVVQLLGHSLLSCERTEDKGLVQLHNVGRSMVKKVTVMSANLKALF